MNRKLMLLVSGFLIVLLSACNTNSNNNRYLKLSDFADGPYASFIDSKTEEVIFINLETMKIQKRISLKE